MNTIEDFLERNKKFAARESAQGALLPNLPQALPNVKALIVGCADMRVDPANILALEAGEAVVMRNIGGRITPHTLEMLGLLGRIGEVAGENPGGGRPFNLIVLQHTDCGITRLAHDKDLLENYFSTGNDVAAEKAIMDPHAAVAIDVTQLRAVEALPAQWLVSGLVYDVATGLIDVVVPPAPLRSAAAFTA